MTTMKKTKAIKILLLPLILSNPLLLMGCSTTLAAAGISVAAVGGYFLGQDKRDLKTIAQDSEMSGQINNAYFSEPLINPMQINVTVRNGVVVLKGTVASEGIAQHAVQIAQQTRGVKQVITRLKIIPPDQYLLGVEDD
jgi:PBP1b-binding outer membrane lipoprotein LpoB